MCGIWGWWHRDGRPAVEEGVIRRSTKVMWPRGPDDFGCYRSASGLAMGFRRLSIIDLKSGHQPMGNEDGNIQVTLNGEIYNFKSLRERLLGLGHRFRTNSDTEVIVHGYEQWGTEVLDHLCGMFGLAIWDEQQRRLVLARDRLGIKPVYYVDGPNAFGYASDSRALVDMPGVDKSIDEEALALFLYYGNVPAPWTIHRGVRKLRPAHMCVIEEGAARARKYWHLSFQPQRRSGKVCLAQFSELYRKVVGEHLISDVPLGSFLSGGMDSTSIVQAAAETTREPLLTFNVAFADRDANEARWAEEAAQTLGTDHHQLDMPENPDESIIETLSRLPEPFGDTAAVPNYLLSREIRKHCTVALSGDGGDEVFGGYGLRTVQAITYLRRFPKIFRKLGARLPGIGELTAASLQDIPTYYARCRARFSIDQIEQIMDSDCKPRQAIESHIEMMRDDLRNSNARGPINPSLFLDQSFGLPDQMLTKVDVTSMAHSLEVRVPLLDHRMVEFAASLPEEMKQKGFGPNRTKKIIRLYLKRLFPKSFINRPKKGFGVPLKPMLFERLEKEIFTNKVCSEQNLPRMLNVERLQGLVDSHTLHPDALWTLHALLVWCEKVKGQFK